MVQQLIKITLHPRKGKQLGTIKIYRPQIFLGLNVYIQRSAYFLSDCWTKDMSVQSTAIVSAMSAQ